jgi:hypothetical protein
MQVYKKRAGMEWKANPSRALSNKHYLSEIIELSDGQFVINTNKEYFFYKLLFLNYSLSIDYRDLVNIMERRLRV